MNIILAGMPGCGKTTVSKVLAQRGVKVLDTDAEIVKKHGNINEIFKKFGEEYFRNLETETVKEISALSDVVISTGGGCLMRKENVDCLKKSGKIVYLKATIETLEKRLKGDTTRPLLSGGVKSGLERLYKERAAVYEASADVVIDTDGVTPEELARRIGKLI